MIDALDQGTCVHVRGKEKTDRYYSTVISFERRTEGDNLRKLCGRCEYSCRRSIYITGSGRDERHTSCKQGIFRWTSVSESETYISGWKDHRLYMYELEDEAQNKKYIYDNVLKNHETLPLGEFAIGTNTTAYVAAKKFNIEDKMPILIAEKTGPHFAVGDTCYSWSEEIRVYNPNGKEIVAKDNSCSLLRKEDVSKAYFNCHTDITVPYKELEEISVVTNEGKDIILLEDGRFVLPGTEVLNEPLDEAGF